MLALLAAGAAAGAPVVSSYLKLTVPMGGGSTDLFTFPPPDDCPSLPCTDQRVMMAKFIVNEDTDPLSFELLPTVGTKYPITPFSTTGGFASITDQDLGTPAMTVNAELLPDALDVAGYKLIKLTVRFDNNYNDFPADPLKIRAVQHATETRYYMGFRVDGDILTAAEAKITKPHLIQYIADGLLTSFASYVDLPSTHTVNFGQVHVNLNPTYLPEEFWELRNVGTASLDITAISPNPFPAGAFTFENYPLPTLTVKPLNALQRRLTCQPAALGAVPALNVQLTTNAGNLQVNLACTGIQLNSAVLFDLSGSMICNLGDNCSGVPEEQQRLYAARVAALELSHVYNDVLPKARLGLYTYPDRPGTCPSNQQMISLSVIESNVQAWENHLNRNLNHTDLLRRNSGNPATPMNKGIEKVFSVLNPKPENTLAAVFHFGDGEHNCPWGTTPAEWYNSTQFKEAKIPFYTVPFGATGEGWLGTFQQLSANSGGKTFPADMDPNKDLELQTQFKKALGEALDLETLKDPEATIQAGTTAQHALCVSGTSYQLVFSAHWKARGQAPVELKVEMPDHTMLTPSSPAAHPGHVTYTSGENWASYVVRGKFLKGDTGAGIWKLHVKGNVTTPYVYQVYSKDLLKSEARFELGTIGKLPKLQVMYPAGPYSVAAASLVARYEAPSASYNNYLAQTPVTPELMARVPQDLAQHMTLAQRKQYALANFADKPFTAKPVTGAVRFGELAKLDQQSTAAPSMTALPEAGMMSAVAMSATAAAGGKVYLQELPVAKYDGIYKLLVTVRGLDNRGQCFEREYSTDKLLAVLLTGKFIAQAIKYEEPIPKPFFDKDLAERLKAPLPEGMDRKLVTFTPVDESGIFWGVGRAAELTWNIEGAERIGSPVDNLDGSYSQAIEFKKDANPRVIIETDGVKGEPVSLKPLVPDTCQNCRRIPLPAMGMIVFGLLVLAQSPKRKRKP